MGKSTKPKPSNRKKKWYNSACVTANTARARCAKIGKKLAADKGILKVLKSLTSETLSRVKRNEVAYVRVSKAVAVSDAKRNALRKQVFGTPARRTKEPDLNSVKARRIPGLVNNIRGVIEAISSPYVQYTAPNEVQKANAWSKMWTCTHRQGRNRSCVVAAMLNLVQRILSRLNLFLPISTLAEALTEKVGSDAGGFCVDGVIAHLNRVLQESTKVYVIDHTKTHFRLRFAVDLMSTITGGDAIRAFARSKQARKGLFLICIENTTIGHCLAAQGHTDPSHFNVIPSSSTDPEVIHVNKVSSVFCLQMRDIELRPITGGNNVWTPVASYAAPVPPCDSR